MKSPELDVLNYHKSGWRRVAFNVRLTLWRMGLGGLVARKRVIIAATGHKTGKPRHTIAPFVRHNDQVVVWAGWSKASHWVKNLTAHPLVNLQTGRAPEACLAQPVTKPDDLRAIYQVFESSGLVKTIGADLKNVDDFLAKKDNAHLFRFVPADDKRHAPHPLKVDLWWVPALIVVALVAALIVSVL